MYKLHSFCSYIFLILCVSQSLQAQEITTNRQPGTPQVSQNTDKLAEFEKLIKDHIDVMQGLTKVLNLVVDEGTATTNAKQIEEWAVKMHEVKGRANRLGTPSADVEQQLNKKYQVQIKKVANALMKTIYRIGQEPAANKIVQAALQKNTP